jgi:hypothetical protein
MIVHVLLKRVQVQTLGAPGKLKKLELCCPSSDLTGAIVRNDRENLNPDWNIYLPDVPLC